MLLNYFLFAVLFYFVYRAARNLMRAVRGELDAPSSTPRFGAESSERRDAAYRRWQDLSSRRSQNGTQTNRRQTSHGQANHRSESDPTTFWGDDIEDAKWEDLE